MSGQAAGLNVGALPAAADGIVDTLLDAAEAGCGEVPVARIAAHITVESGWDPRAVNATSGASGLVQFMPATWVAVGGAGGTWPTGSRPPVAHPVFDPTTHLARAVQLFCDNAAAMRAHLATAPDKPVSLLDAVAVCHVAGCSRVTNSTTGIPTAGDVVATGCQAVCVRTVAAYVERVNDLTVRYTAVGGAAPPVVVDGLPAPPVPYTGMSSGCGLVDPTGTGGCVTGVADNLYRQTLAAAGGSWPAGIGCWGQRPTNPTSDHPSGRACDFTVGTIGAFPTEAERAAGWMWAEWFRTYHAVLEVTYVVWDGRIWNANRDDQGWRPYRPGAAYDESTPTGGHYDHLHVSVAR
nr:transglycosylase SLT domain-containing protein [Salsipaludibacter albus]